MTAYPDRRRGFSLIELLIVIVMLSIVMGVTFTLFQAQSESFRGNTNRFDLVQNARGASEFSERVIRTMGAGVSGEQPVLVYGANNVLAFNTDYVERDTVDMRWSAYWNPDTPLAETITWKVADAAVIPNSSPAYTYPTVDYTLGNTSPSPAETHILYLQLDGDTPRSDDYALWERVNNGTPELIARSILPASNGDPFFEYLMQRVLPGGDTLFTAPASMLPLIRKSLVGVTTAADSAANTRPDSVRAIRMNYRVSNGRTGADERLREISTVIEVPNNGIPMPTVCGRKPLPPGSFSAVEVGTGLGTVQLNWTRSADQDGAEADVRQYVIWRSTSSPANKNAPILYLRAEHDTTNYNTILSDNTPGQSYIFGIASQDCTPDFSTIITAALTLSP